MSFLKSTHVASTFAFSALLLATAATAHQHLPGEQNALEREALLKGFGWDIATAEIRTEKIAEGLYVLFGLGGNIAVSVGKDGTLIVDDQLPELADRIKAAIAELGGGGIDYVINTHWHFDHADGNNALGPDGATIISHDTARSDMADGGIINMVIAQYHQAPYPEAALPELTYQREMSLHFNGGEIELKHFSHAHTNGDTAVFFANTTLCTSETSLITQATRSLT